MQVPALDFFGPAVEKLLDLADGLYAEGYGGLRYIPGRARYAIRIAGRIYQEIGNEIRRQNYQVMNQRVFVTTRGKLAIAARCLGVETGFRLRQLFPPPLADVLQPGSSHES